jgi:hypothetical protein
MPLSPALESPMINAPNRMSTQLVTEYADNISIVFLQVCQPLKGWQTLATCFLQDSGP